MFGTALATSTLMASNFIGTRVFTLGVYSNSYAKSFTFAQNHRVSSTGLKLDPVTVKTTPITQNHKMDDVAIVSQPFIQSTVIRQNQKFVGRGQYLTTFVKTIPITQNHKVSGNVITLNPFVVSGDFHQQHNMISRGVNLFPNVDQPVIKQNHIMVSLGEFTTTDIPIGNFGQNHIVAGNQLDMETTISDPTDFYQQHLLVPDYLKVDPFQVGKPFVNPSIRRNALFTGTSYMLVTTDKENFALIFDPATNKYI